MEMPEPKIIQLTQEDKDKRETVASLKEIIIKNIIAQCISKKSTAADLITLANNVKKLPKDLQEEIFKYLVKNEAPFQKQIEDKIKVTVHTPYVQAAIRNGFTDIAKILLEAGANPDQKEYHTFFIDHEIRKLDRHSPLEETIENNDLVHAQLLLSYRANINAHILRSIIPWKEAKHMWSDVTLLHYAAFHGNHKIVKFLLDNGADKTLKTNTDPYQTRYTAFEIAFEKDHDECCKLLDPSYKSHADIIAAKNYGLSDLLDLLDLFL